MTGFNSLGFNNSYANYASLSGLNGLSATGLTPDATSLALLGLGGFNGLTGANNLYGYNGYSNGLSMGYPLYNAAINQDASQTIQQMFSYFQCLLGGQGDLSSLTGQQQFAPPPPPTVGQVFGAADTSGDGAISEEEFTAHQPTGPGGQTRPALSTEMKANLFACLDQDGDGSISAEEQQAIAPPPPRHYFSFKGAPYQP